MNIQSLYRNYSSYNTNTDPSNFGGGSTDYSQYEQTLLQYISQVKMQMQTLQKGTPAYQQAAEYLNTAMGYLQMVDPQMEMNPSLGGSDWDPMGMGMSSNGMGVPTDDAQQASQFPIDYQDGTHIVTSDGLSSSYTLDSKDSETRTIDFYQKDNTLIVPSNAANISLSAQPDDAVPGKTMIVVTYTCNGQTRTLHYHNVDRDNFKLNVQAPDKSQATLDASLGAFQSKVNVTELGDISAQAQGTPPDKTDGNTRTWNTNDQVDYYATEGKETDKIYADSVNITLPDRSHKVYVTKTGAHDYSIDIQDENGKVIRHIEAHQVKNLNFDHVSDDNLFFQDDSSANSTVSQGNSVNQTIQVKLPQDHFKAWSDPDHDQDSQITLDGVSDAGSNGDTGNPNPTPSNTKDGGKTGVFNKDANPSFTNYFNGGLSTYEITANGTVKITTANQNDHFSISKQDNWYVITATGTDDKGNAKTLTYKIDATRVSKVELDGINPNGSVSFDGSMTNDDQSKFITQDGKTIAEGQKAASPDAKYPQALQDFAAFRGLKIEDVVNAIKSACPWAPTDATAFNTWLQKMDNWLPNPPTQKSIQMLFGMDTELSKSLNAVKGKNLNDVRQAVCQMEDRLVGDLQKLYPDQAANISVANYQRHGDGFDSGRTWFQVAVQFGSTKYLLFPELQGNEPLKNLVWDNSFSHWDKKDTDLDGNTD